MNLFEFEYNDQSIRLSGSNLSGLEKLYIDGIEVLSKRSFKMGNSYDINLNDLGLCQLHFKIDLSNDVVNIHILNQEDDMIFQTQQTMKSLFDKKKSEEYTEQSEAHTQPENTQTKEPNKWLNASIMVLLFKLFKSAKVIKIALLAVTAGAYSIIFSWQFALVLIGVLVFHELGHVFAMKKSGLKTKGFYIIPFVGGMAVSERAKSNWQEVFISMMGPVFGLAMSIAFYIAFVVTQNHFIGLVATFSALINLFNLLPVYPLDGGHVIKAIVFSFKKYVGFVVLTAISALGFVLAFMTGWYLLCFFIAIGFLDLVFSWKRFSSLNIPPLDKYGMIFSLAWYFVTVAVFVGILVLMIKSGLPGTEVVSTILSS